MIETAAIIGIVTPVFLMQIYNARKIKSLETKVDLIYDNLDIKLHFKNNHKKEKE